MNRLIVVFITVLFICSACSNSTVIDYVGVGSHDDNWELVKGNRESDTGEGNIYNFRIKYVGDDVISMDGSISYEIYLLAGTWGEGSLVISDSDRLYNGATVYLTKDIKNGYVKDFEDLSDSFMGMTYSDDDPGVIMVTYSKNGKEITDSIKFEVKK